MKEGELPELPDESNLPYVTVEVSMGSTQGEENAIPLEAGAEALFKDGQEWDLKVLIRLRRLRDVKRLDGISPLDMPDNGSNNRDSGLGQIEDPQKGNYGEGNL